MQPIYLMIASTCYQFPILRITYPGPKALYLKNTARINSP